MTFSYVKGQIVTILDIDWLVKKIIIVFNHVYITVFNHV